MITWNPGMSLKDLEKLVIQKAISFYNSEEAAARALGIEFKQFSKKIIKIKEEDEENKQKLEIKKQEEEEYIGRARGINTFGP
jgi:hypothetical protein